MNDTKHDAVEPRAKHPGLFQKKKNKVQPIDGSGRPVKPPKRKKLWSELESGAWRPSAFLIRDALILQGDLEEVKERLRNTTSTVGIVSALIVTMTFPYIIAQPEGKCDEEGNGDHPILNAFQLLNYTSFTISLAIIAFVALFLVQLDMCCHEQQTADFIYNFAFTVELMNWVFVLGLFATAIEALMLTWCNVPRRIAIGVYIIAGFFVGLVGLTSLVIFFWNRVQVTRYGRSLAIKVHDESRRASQADLGQAATKQAAQLGYEEEEGEDDGEGAAGGDSVQGMGDAAQ